MESTDDTISLYFHTYFENMASIREIDHVPEEIIFLNPDLNSQDSDFFQSLGIIIVENSMAISFNIFDTLYPLCLSVVLGMKTIEKPTENEKITLNMASKIILCLNGEINTAFTVRKKLLDDGFLKNFGEELHFVNLVCLKFKKASVAWAYKLYVTQKIWSKMTEKDLLGFFEKEVSFIESYLVKHPRNYYAWSHRLILLKELMEKLSNEKKIVLLDKELKSIKKFCEKNIHEYSAFHYLQFVTKKLVEAKCIDVNDEKAWILQLIMIYGECYEENNGKNDRTVKELFSLKKHMKYLEQF